MEFYQYPIIIFLFLQRANNAEIRGDFYRADERYSDVLPRSEILWTRPSYLRRCALDCFMDTHCESVFYGNGQCHGYIRKLHDFIDQIATTGMRYYEMAGPVGNVAAGKPAFQSSTLFNAGFEAAFAVDGRRYPIQNAVPSLRSCSHTLAVGTGDDAPFWEVDLNATYKITSISFLGRQECCGERNSGLNITVAESSAGPYNLCYYYPLGPGFVNEMKTFYCTQPLTGRLVRISRTVDVLNPCEIEVYGYPLNQ